jgi:hypothetical protein
MCSDVLDLIAGSAKGYKDCGNDIALSGILTQCALFFAEVGSLVGGTVEDSMQTYEAVLTELSTGYSPKVWNRYPVISPETVILPEEMKDYFFNIFSCLLEDGYDREGVIRQYGADILMAVSSLTVQVMGHLCDRNNETFEDAIRRFMAEVRQALDDREQRDM